MTLERDIRSNPAGRGRHATYVSHRRQTRTRYHALPGTYAVEHPRRTESIASCGSEEAGDPLPAGRPLTPQLCLDQGIDGATVGPSCQFGHCRLHRLPHVLGADGTHLGDDLL